ncbi:endolytic transglycosylase MltG [Campylobacter molothri]|uniref:endolytic transglycosylase MltG n=1 Tax=Campylobacter molothri TaxID=1032242 RepID=UPI001DCF9AD0|nr:endolytic transglycosylase MltG [Campylobacter sp. RM10537]MBZ7937545.1 endolytic transglycosylase MltG [Campylobacter sp. RM10538]MBZ7949117.1 endolytic transglycosylase MltG [Campylobacter sp. RM10534]MBZ7959133.1 endolytic transglycosylase MltG [Campylobacter sp. RM12397]ULO00077.1 YceG-like protein [Campylobacter sp. RM10537]
MNIPFFNTKNITENNTNNITNIYNIFFFIRNFLLIFIMGICYYLIQPLKSDSVIFIPKGSIAQIISYLKEKKYEMNTIDKYILFFLGHPQSGWIDLGMQKLNRIDFLYKLTVAKAALETITLIPGETSIVFLDQVSKKLDLNKETLLSEFQKQSPYPEGVFLPETYEIPKGISESLLIQNLLAISEKSNQITSKKIFGEYNRKKWHQYIIVASVIQKEAANESEMPIVASVIYNRLKKGMKLQMDGTLNYGIYSHEKITPQRIRQDKTFYNTYKFEGLPKEAVCNVSLAAIRAAIFPAKTDYLYFVRDKKTGVHIFTNNLNDHNKAINSQKNR